MRIGAFDDFHRADLVGDLERLAQVADGGETLGLVDGFVHKISANSK